MCTPGIERVDYCVRTPTIDRSSRQTLHGVGHQHYAPVHNPGASAPNLTDQRDLTVLETRALANFGPHGPAKADLGPPPKNYQTSEI
jgi:hypothetical protein